MATETGFPGNGSLSLGWGVEGPAVALTTVILSAAGRRGMVAYKVRCTRDIFAWRVAFIDQIFVQRVTNLRGVDLFSSPILRIGCQQGAESRERVAENYPAFCRNGLNRADNERKAMKMRCFSALFATVGLRSGMG